jgi:hypothetical protein
VAKKKKITDPLVDLLEAAKPVTLIKLIAELAQKSNLTLRPDSEQAQFKEHLMKRKIAQFVVLTLEKGEEILELAYRVVSQHGTTYLYRVETRPQLAIKTANPPTGESLTV